MKGRSSQVSAVAYESSCLKMARVLQIDMDFLWEFSKCAFDWA